MSSQSLDGEDFELRQLAWTNLTQLLRHNPAGVSSQARSFFRCHVPAHPTLSAPPNLGDVWLISLYSGGCMPIQLLHGPADTMLILQLDKYDIVASSVLKSQLWLLLSICHGV